MEKNSDILLEKPLGGDSALKTAGAAAFGPLGAIGGAVGNVGLKKLYKWARKKYKDYKKNKKNASDAQDNTEINTEQQPQTDEEENITTSDTQNNDEELQKKIQAAQDEIKNAGMFEPEVYDNHTFYKSTIYDERDPENNNFIYISKGKDGAKQAYQNFLDYWTKKWAEERGGRVSKYEQEEYQELIKDRFPLEANKKCLISVPQYFIMDSPDVLSMAKNSDILSHEKVIYDDRPSFDSNYAFDMHMSKYKQESDDDDNIQDYKISILSFSAFGRKYVYAFDGNRNRDSEIENVILSITDELVPNDLNIHDKLSAFSQVLQPLVDSEQCTINNYSVASPMLIKNSNKVEDMEHNADLVNGIHFYEDRNQFIKNYLEDYMKLLDNQMLV